MISNPSARGFTLIELITVILIAAILMALAAPPFRALILNNRITTQTNNFISALNLARSEAVKRGVSATLVCTGNVCGNGWSVFIDENASCSIDGTETAIRIYDGLSGNTLNTDAPPPCVAFNAQGQAAAGNFFLCDDRGKDYGRKIAISVTGRVEADDIAAVGETCTP
jgi:type IV fimbrial biogenesis protein FimT